MAFATFEGLGGTGDDRQEAAWSPTAKHATIAVVAVLGGLFLIAGLSRLNVCPKLHRQYTDNWLNHGYGLAEWTKREAASKGCRWALEKPVDVMREQGVR